MKHVYLYGFLIIYFTSSISSAQTQVQFDNVDIDLYRPIISRQNSGFSKGASTIHIQTFGYGAWLEYTHNPLVWRGNDGTQYQAVKGQFFLKPLIAYAPTQWLELQTCLPILLYQMQAEDTGIGVLPDTTIGDLRVLARVPIKPWGDDALQFALALEITFPTGNGEALIGSSGVTYWPSFSLSIPFDPFTISFDIGYKSKPKSMLATLEINDELTLSASFVKPTSFFDTRMQIFASIYNQSKFKDFYAYNDATAIEVLGGLNVQIVKDWWIQAGLGIGLGHGYGSPDFRFIFGSYHVADSPDSDGDGFVDPLDNCPLLAEDYDGIDDNDGCPEEDSDLDGIPDEIDHCPLKPEDFDNQDDEDGCPEVSGPDRDHDGIEDRIDYCPDDPEDIDDFEDSDGCPDYDRDEDSVPDDKDKCPDVKETINGYLDEDGCPDDKGEALTEIEKEEKIVIKGQILFESGRDTILAKSMTILNQVAKQILSHPKIQMVRIEGHTDSLGSASLNLSLSQQRAESVRKYLVSQGVSRSRLRAVGFGETKPIANNATPRGRQLNRRVEFHIEKTNPKP